MRERTMQEGEPLLEIAAGRTGLGKMFQRRHRREVVRRKRLLANGEDAAQHALRRLVSADRGVNGRQTGQYGGDLGMLLATRALDFEEPLQHRLRLCERAAAQVDSGEAA